MKSNLINARMALGRLLAHGESHEDLVIRAIFISHALHVLEPCGLLRIFTNGQREDFVDEIEEETVCKVFINRCYGLIEMDHSQMGNTMVLPAIQLEVFLVVNFIEEFITDVNQLQSVRSARLLEFAGLGDVEVMERLISDADLRHILNSVELQAVGVYYTNLLKHLEENRSASTSDAGLATEC